MKDQKTQPDIPELDDDVDAYTIKEIKLNPDFLYFRALMGLQKAAEMEDIEKGTVLYRQTVEHMEMLAKGFGRVPKDYDDEIRNFINKEEYSQLDTRRRNFELARFKATLMVQKISDSLPMKDKISL